MPKVEKESIAYYFSNFALFGNVYRRCVTKRFYLRDNISSMIDRSLLGQFEKLACNVQIRDSSGQTTGYDLVNLCYDCWILDQFYYDIVAFKTKMVACYVEEYYNPSSIACFVGCRSSEIGRV